MKARPEPHQETSKTMSTVVSIRVNWRRAEAGTNNDYAMAPRSPGVSKVILKRSLQSVAENWQGRTNLGSRLPKGWLGRIAGGISTGVPHVGYELWRRPIAFRDFPSQSSASGLGLADNMGWAPYNHSPDGIGFFEQT